MGDTREISTRGYIFRIKWFGATKTDSIPVCSVCSVTGHRGAIVSRVLFNREGAESRSKNIWMLGRKFLLLWFLSNSQVSKRAQIKGGSLWHRWVNLLRAKRILLQREGMHITSVSKVRLTIFILASKILPAKHATCALQNCTKKTHCSGFHAALCV